MTNKPNDGGPAWHPEIIPNSPAFPLRGTDDLAGNPSKWTWLGLTKREYFAGLAMQGFITMPSADKNATFDGHATGEKIAFLSVQMADALLAELNKPNT